MDTQGIYIHIPFCASKCGYCNFYSSPQSRPVQERYAAALLAAMEAAPSRGVPADSLYFGGGTPSLLGEELLCVLLEGVRRCFSLTPDCEITLEANPDSLSPKLLSALRRAGVNRLSVGVQSLKEEQLRLLGRRHTAAQALESIAWAREAGFENISADLMLALPGQTADDVSHFCRRLAAAGACHISAYLLKVEEGTPFARGGVEKLCPGEEEQARLYLETVRILEKLGLRQYEISNFALPGRESRHNTRYWLCGEYLGLGPAAHSFTAGRRRFFPPDLEAFLRAAEEREVWSLWQDDGAGGGFEEEVMLGLRLSRGIDLAALAEKYPGETLPGLPLLRGRLEREGLLRCRGSRICLTPEGFLLSNSIISRLLFG